MPSADSHAEGAPKMDYAEALERTETPEDIDAAA